MTKDKPPIGGVSQYAVLGGGKKNEAESALSHERKNALSQDHTPAIVRTKRGYALRDDLVKAAKRLALEEDRHLYEIMEEALEEYLARKRTSAKVRKE